MLVKVIYLCVCMHTYQCVCARVCLSQRTTSGVLSIWYGTAVAHMNSQQLGRSRPAQVRVHPIPSRREEGTHEA